MRGRGITAGPACSELEGRIQMPFAHPRGSTPFVQGFVRVAFLLFSLPHGLLLLEGFINGFDPFLCLDTRCEFKKIGNLVSLVCLFTWSVC